MADTIARMNICATSSVVRFIAGHRVILNHHHHRSWMGGMSRHSSGVGGHSRRMSGDSSYTLAEAQHDAERLNKDALQKT